jgi:hypothetical protein
VRLDHHFFSCRTNCQQDEGQGWAQELNRRFGSFAQSSSRQQVSGGITGGATPDPIPNSEVKPSRADGTARDTVWESRSPPDFFCSQGSVFENRIAEARKREGFSKFKEPGTFGSTGSSIHKIGEFDPGSERTLAAGLTHASRARKGLRPQVQRRTGA